ncbi:hypothetical protein DMC30DRAFT_347200, partial [Rhodotorula diobovata]
RRSNPLADLIATETAYVEDLGVIIKRVAAAWSRANFPPPVLDAMFRAVEAVYRVNKGLLAKLLEIGPSPSSPKALGDLLMRWIDEIEPAYTRYAATLQSGYDTHAPVQSNPRLAPILASLPWPSTLPLLSDDPAAAPAPAPGPTVTLDALFALPVTRVGYYQRLYAKLLRSTQEGRSDHALLVSANDKLRRLAAQVPPRLELDLGGPPLPSSSASARAPHGSDGSGAGLDSPSGSSSYRSSGATGASTANTSATQSGVYAAAAAATPPPLRVEDLEHRLDPSRALDIFTMQPRKCKLQMQPPSLAFKRQLRKTGPVALSFVPSSDPSGRQVRIPRAHLVLLTDLFLVCAPVEPADEHAASPGADYWLLYPPLAGKHLRVRDADSQGEFEVAIMGKERLTFRAVGDAGAGLGAGAEEQQAREWRAALDEATRMLSSGSHPAPPSSLSHTGAGGGAYTGGAFVQSPTGSAFPHSPVGTGPGSSRGASPYPGSESSAYGRQSPYGQQQQQQQQQAPFSSSHAQDFTPPPPLQQQQQGQGQYGHPSSAYPMPRSPHSAHDFSSSSRPSSSRPSSRQSNGSYASSQAYPEFDPRAAAPPPLPKERSYNGVDISGRGGPLYATSLQGSAGPPSSRTGSGMLAPHSSSQQQVHRSRSADGLRSPPPPSHAPGQGHAHGGAGGFGSHPPASPTEERGPAQQHRPDDKTSVVAQMRCKIFLQQHHSVWKSLGTGKLKLFYSLPSGTKQLVVDSDKGGGKTVISTIVLTDGVERVGKTGVAIELSDQGDRTGIVYMLQASLFPTASSLGTEQSATGLFEQLLLGTDRAKR